MTPSHTNTATSFRNRLRSLLRSAGRPAAANVRWREVFEHLENRVLLAGDEPGLNQVFGTANPVVPPVIVLNGQGVGTSVTGSGSSTIGVAGEDDMFSFIAPGNDFVTIWGDARNTGSTLNSRVEVYTGTIGGTATLVVAGTDHGPTTAGTLIDGWAGFIATAGTQYFVRVRSDIPSGPGSLGDYILRIDALSTLFPTLDPSGGDGSAAGSITLPGGDIVYKVVTGTEPVFNGVAVVQSTAVSTDLDPRLDIYSGTTGLRIANDSDAGNLTDSYLAMKITAGTTYYVRVRSDEFGDPLLRPSTGAFTVIFDGIGRNTNLDPVTRLGGTGTRSVADQKSVDFFRFKSQGTGLSFITINTGIPFGMPDSAVHLYDDTGVQIGFNELTGGISRLQIQLIGGRTYWAVVENFGGAAGGLYRGEIEAHHTFDTNFPVDDHISTPTIPQSPPEFGTPEYDALRRTFELATPIIWSDPQDAQTPNISNPPPPTVSTPDHSMVIIGTLTGRIHDAGETDLFQFTPPIDMLGEFAGVQDPDTPGTPPVLPTIWLPYYRPATSVEIHVSAETLFNASVRIFDSNFTQIYPGQGVNTNVLTAGADPAGALDPASWPPTLDPQLYGYTYAQGQPVHIDMWGGEVYYLEVSGSGSGRYNGTIQVDAGTDHGVTGPPAQAPTSTFFPDLAKAGNFAGAREIQIDQNSGEGRNFSNVAGGQIVTLPGPQYTAAPGLGASGINLGRSFYMNLTKPVPPAAGTGANITNFIGTPGTRGRLIFRMSDLGILQTPTDTQLYQFRALYTGTAEVRAATTQITDGHFEGMVQSEDGNPMTPPVIENVEGKTKTYNSQLDAALRIFDNDQTEIAYNNDNSVTAGENDVRGMGSLGNRTYERRDPRVVFPVEAGKIYYIQVESGQRQNFNLTFPKVDWRHAIGSYELLVNSMSNLNFDDDHVDGPAPNVQATNIPISLATTSTTAPLGSVPGQIDHTLANQVDIDLFTFLSPSSGNAKIVVSTTNNDSWGRIVTALDIAGNVIGQVTVTGTDDAVINVNAVQGDRIFVQVAGAPIPNTTPQEFEEGRYRVTISGVPYVDDHSSAPDFFNATIIDKDLYDYDKTESVLGAVESPGDSDVFTFQTIAYDVATITIQSLSTATFHPAVRVYEIGDDGGAHPVLLQIAHRSSPGATASVSFSLTAPPRTAGSNGNTFNSYFVIVSGANPNLDQGNYRLTLTLNINTDDHPDAGQYALADPIALTPNAATFLATGNASGNIELTGDTDLFKFTSPSQGRATVTITSPAGSLLFPRVRIFDENQQPVIDVNGQTFITGPDQQVSTAVFRFTALRDGVYYIQVEGVTTFNNVFKTADTGGYTVDVVAPIPDDHPNVGEFPIADPINVSPFSGDGSGNGILEIATDTDLFKFTTVANGNMVVSIVSPGNEFRPFLRLFRADFSEIGTGVRDGQVPGDEDGQLNGAVTRTISGTLIGQVYYVLVSSDQTEPPTHITGGYTVILDGAAPPTGPDDHANAGDYNNATLIPLDFRTGDAKATGNIEVQIDTDLFVFNSLAGTPARPRRAFVQVITPAGSTLDVGLRIFTLIGGAHVQIASDTGGGPGVNAKVEFNIDAPNKKYWVEVDGLLNNGSYSVSVDTEPNTFFLYYPEGFANSVIREYIAIGNSNSFAVTYTVRLKFEDGTIPDVAITRTIPANSRGGETISDGTSTNPLLQQGLVFNKPYAIIVESDGFIAANLSHYDFGNTLGESFTGTPSTTWSFSQGQKFHGQVNDFLIYYNPNSTAVRVTLTAYQTGTNGSVTSVAMSQVVQGFKRLGWAFDQTALLPVGTFAFTVTSAPVNASDDHVGIVAALSHYDLANSVGYAVLGDPEGGARTGVIPGLISTATSSPFITLFNPTSSVANVSIVGKYLNSGLPDLIKSVTLNPRESRTFDAVGMGLVANQTVGLRYDSNVAVSVLADTRAAGDADGTQANTVAGQSFFFGDAFINRNRAGILYFENMYFYNPDTSALPITLTFQFSNGGVSSYSFIVGPKDFATVALHELPAILNHAVFNWFSINATAENPFAVTLNHYDLVLAGGWGTKGAPLGPTVPLVNI